MNKKISFLAALVMIFGLGVLSNFWQTSPQIKTTNTTTNTQPIIDLKQDIKNWQDIQVLTHPFLDLSALLTKAGATARKEPTLDFEGNIGDSYHYHGSHEPPFYVINSEKFFEVSWYYANNKNHLQEQQIAQKYAQQAHQLIAHILKNPKPLLQDILNEKTPNYPKGVATAQCQSHLCTVVFDKTKF